MRLYAVTAAIPGTDLKVCHEFHFTVFHGFVSSNLRIESSQYPSLIGASKAKPLHLTRTGVDVPSVFGPFTSLFINKPTRLALETFPGLEFLDVKFDKLVDFRCPPGDMTYRSLSKCAFEAENATERFLSRMADVPEFHQTIGDRYELVCKSVEVLMRKQDQYHPTAQVCVNVGLDKSENLEGPLDPRLFEEYAVLDMCFSHLMVPEVFEIIGPQLSENFYFIREIEL